MNDKVLNLKKLIRYRISYTGTKETDILYERLILGKLDNLIEDELLLLSQLFTEISDIDIFNILTNKSKIPLKYNKIINKIINE
tara:strand:+ start:216 stop:467 length:252 start_codon:yes stop_codon:yes gene_type:complete